MSKKARKPHNIFRTKENKIRRAKKELSKNPNNVSVKKSLEFWEKNDRKKKGKKNESL